MSLQDSVKIARRFQRSIHIAADLDSPTALEGFILPESSRSVLRAMARYARETGHTAFTWTGPYGSGKSSLLLVLASLLGPSTSARNVARQFLGREAAEVFEGAFPRKSTGWTVLPLVGSRAGVATLLVEALVDRGLAKRRSAGHWSEQRVVGELVSLAQRSKGAGLLIILDEMGKLLEAAALGGADVYLLQLLAEAASRSQGRLVIVGVLHQAFDEYAQRLSREARDEWAKVQGRFVDLAVGGSGDEQLELLAQAIDAPGRHAMPSAALVARVIASGQDKSRQVRSTLEACWPLDAVTACLLGPISRRRFGQNQRSLFGFLSSAEPWGFQEFLRTAAQSDLYRADRLWDYLHANLEPAIVASPDGHRWSMAVEALDRCARKENSALHLALLKTIALIDLFRERSGLVATKQLLIASVEYKKGVDRALSELAEWSLVVYRRHLGSYAVFAGSDFDIEEALAREIAELREVDLVALGALAGLQPVLAKRHYHQTGALRWLNVRFVPLSGVEAAANTPHLSGDAIGEFLMAIPTENDPERGATEACRKAAAESQANVVIGLSPLAPRILQLAREFLAMSRVLDSAPELAGDAVARREVSARVSDLRTRLESDLQRMMNSAEWVRHGSASRLCSLYELNVLASDIADELYADGPRLHSELLNRVKPSSNAVAAQKALLKRMVSAEGHVRLSIDGYPAEGGLFDSLLHATGLYGETAGTLSFCEPAGQDPAHLAAAWAAAHRLVENKGFIVTLDELYELWRRPPFGVKNGLLPVLALAFILANRRSLAFYREGVFQHRFTDLEVDYLAIDPSSIGIRWISLSGDSRDLMQSLAGIVKTFSGAHQLTSNEPIEIARGLVGIYERLAPWTKRTALLSAPANAVRQLLKQAADPNKLVFDDLPKVVIGHGKQGAVFINTLEEGISELVGAHRRMLEDLVGLLLRELDANGGDESSQELLRKRAANVREMSGDFRVDAFVNRLVAFKNADSDIEGIASLLVNKPARDWVDADLDRARIELAAMCAAFRRLETFARVKGRPDGRHALAVMVGGGQGAEPLAALFEIAHSDLAQVGSVAQTIQAAVASLGGAKREVILAALAEVSSTYLKTTTARDVARLGKE